MSDDGWYGDPQEPAPTPGAGYGPGRGRRAANGHEQQAAGRPGQYPQQAAQSDQYQQSGQYSQPGQYVQGQSQEPYQPNQYPQGYAAQPQQSYYDELGPRSTPPQSWNSSQQQDYQDPQAYQQSSYQQPYEQAHSYEAPPSYEQPQPYEQAQYEPQSYEQQGYRSQPQASTGRRAQTARPPQPSPPVADPYASGSSGTYNADPYRADPYNSGVHTPDPYASSSDQYQHPSGSYAADPYASGTYTRSGRDATAGSDTNGNGTGYASGARDAYASGEYPSGEYPSGDQSTGDRDRRRRSGDYPVNGAGYASGSHSTGNYVQPDPAAPGRRAANGQAQTQLQDPYVPRRGAALDTSGDYAQYENDEYPGTSRSPRRAPDFGSEAGDRAEGAPRSRRRAAAPQDEPDEGGFSLIDEEDGGDAGSGRERKPKQKKGRNCLAVFIAFSVIAGGLGYGGYKGVQWYQGKYGAPPDYVSTTGTGVKVDVAIPGGSGGRTIGGLLFDKGVVKSQRAFTNACNADPKCANIQAGTYLLPTGISAAAAITALLDPKNEDSKSQLVTFGGERAAQVFAALENKTGWSDADIRAAIAGGQIDLPSWDTGQPGAKFPYAHIEGFISAQTYVLTDYKTPTALLKKMVDDQVTVFNQENLTAKAASLGLTPYKLLIIASLARAEAGTNTADLNKIAGVVFNRFNNPAQFAHLGFDTSTLYGMGNAGTVPDNRDTTNPYNTSVFGIKGLPPTPIDNPDQQSIDAALNPNRASNYMYFCATPDGVQYAATNSQWQALGARYKGLCGSR